MKKVCLSIISVMSIICFVGCSETSNSSFKDVDGGPHSMVVCEYNFDDFDDFLNFYEVFNNYNTQRYWTPVDNDKIDLDISYTFRSEGVLLDYVKERRYDLTFPFQNLFVSINNDDFSFKIDLKDVNSANFNVDVKAPSISFTYGELDYMNNIEVTFMASNFVIGDGKITLNESNEDFDIKAVLSEIAGLFEGGYFYVY